VTDTDTPDTAPREAQEATDAPEDAQNPQEQQQQPQEDAQDAQEDADAPEDASDDQTDTASEDSAAGKARREAAKYRTRLREVEGERDQLAGQLHNLQRAAAVAAAQGPGRLADGGDLFRDDHVQLADLVADDGTVDIDRVAAAAAAVLGRSPHWRHTTPRPTGRPVEALQLNPHGDPAAGWSDVLRGAS